MPHVWILLLYVHTHWTRSFGIQKLPGAGCCVISGNCTKRACSVTIIIITRRRKPTITKGGEPSLQRAERARAELVQRGLPEDNITVTGRGKRELLVPTADGVAEPENRRVEINVR